MADRDQRIAFVCSCEDTMVLDGRALARGCAARGTELRMAEQLCRAQLGRFLGALGEGRPVTVGCTQEAPLFAQEAEAAGGTAPLDFVNLREQAGWATEGAAAGPKMAGLLAAAAVPLPPVPLVPLKSEGVTLVLGRDAGAIAAAERLADRLDLTVLLTGAEPVVPLRTAAFPVLRGRARTATGWLGAFEVVVDGYAAPSPASRAAYAWGPARDGAASRCDIILDLSGAAPLFPAHAVRQGYLRADPADAAAVERAIAAAAGLVGEFDKPRFVDFAPGRCAHGRNRRTGCTRCLDLCPTGAITPGRDAATGRALDHVLVSAEICAGCGACAAVCPTGAATYALPPPATTLARLRALLLGYAEAGGSDPVVLLHDAAQGEPLIDALARHGEGLPARVLPLRLNEVAQADLAILAAAFAWGAAGLRVLLPARRGHGAGGLFRNLDYLGAALDGLGLGAAPPRALAIETDDPFTLGEALAPALALRTGWPPAQFLALGTPREVAVLALRALHEVAPASRRGDTAPLRGDAGPRRSADAAPLRGADAAPLRGTDAAPLRVTDAAPLRVTDAAPLRGTDAAPLRVTDAAPLRGDTRPLAIPLPDQAPFGLARVAAEGCTLCLACSMVCPTGAFSADPDSPALRFVEDACVQCGLCAATCPEQVITLEPRLNFAAAASQPVVVKAEPPAHCSVCAKAFGTRSSIDRVKAKLTASGHWMFADPARLAVLEMCEDCRAIAATQSRVDPYAGPPRPAVKTTEDWLREAARAKAGRLDG